MHVVARWCATHRLVVAGLWLLVLAATFLGSSATGSNYAKSTTLSGTPSATAANLLQRAVPGQSGDTEQIVFQTKTGTVDAAAVRARVTAMLGQVSHLPDVSGMTSPYTPAGLGRSAPTRPLPSPPSTSARTPATSRPPMRPRSLTRPGLPPAFGHAPSTEEQRRPRVSRGCASVVSAPLGTRDG